MIISAGPTNSSLPRGCSPWLRPGSWRANPDEETTDWRAVCGRTASTVRRAGTARAVSDPYQANFGLDPRLKHSGVTTWGKVIRGPLDTPQLAAGLFIIKVAKE